MSQAPEKGSTTIGGPDDPYVTRIPRKPPPPPAEQPDSPATRRNEPSRSPGDATPSPDDTTVPFWDQAGPPPPELVPTPWQPTPPSRGLDVWWGILFSLGVPLWLFLGIMASIAWPFYAGRLAAPIFLAPVAIYTVLVHVLSIRKGRQLIVAGFWIGVSLLFLIFYISCFAILAGL